MIWLLSSSGRERDRRGSERRVWRQPSAPHMLCSDWAHYFSRTTQVSICEEKNEVSLKFSQKCFRMFCCYRPVFKVQAFWNGLSWKRIKLFQR